MTQRLFLRRLENGWWETSIERPSDAPSGTPTDRSVSAIQDLVARYYRVDHHSLTGSRRTRHIVKPRMVAMYLCRKHLRLSYPELGRHFHRTHSTVLCAVRRIEELMDLESALGHEIEELEGELTTEAS